ncbi:MAG: acyl-CoA dehydrogenase family protein [Dehalococcoidia bacterium]|nr:acyl-CoA dehydrogenase family protein [Dehalococcoidia bacterium]
MDFRFTQEQETLRQEVRDWLKKEIPARWIELGIALWEDNDEIWAIARDFERKLARKGWLAPGYPSRYGGIDATSIEQAILSEEKAYAGAPAMLSDVLAVGWVGPTILLFGTDEQKERYVGGIGRGELVFCLGYSEPEAGSDLAAVQTLAVEDGDHYIINGQKIFTSLAHRADYCWMATRTDRDAPKHKGISMFVVDMKMPGVTVRPLINMLGFHEFNEVFFDNVRVPKENMVGEKNRGWYTLAAALNFERSVVYIPAANRRVIEILVSYARETPWEGGVLADNPLIQHKLAEMALENEVCRLLCYRVVWMQSKGLVPASETSVSYLHTADLTRRLAHTGMEMLGLYGQLDRSSKWAPLKGAIKSLCLGALGLGIGGGTNEIQRNLIATIGLGLPRG